MSIKEFDRTKRISLEKEWEWDTLPAIMPWIKFPPDWEIKMMPPFGGADVRFWVKLPSGNIKSIYFDSHDTLGIVGEPYWEVYPYLDDVGRCLANDITQLLEMICNEESDSFNGEWT